MHWREALGRAVGDPRGAIEVARALGRGEAYRRWYRMRGQRVEIGRGFRVIGRLEIRGPGRVVFGDRCEVFSSRLAPTTIYTHEPDAVVRFGDRVRLTGTRIGCSELIEVGEWSGLADARLMDTDFHALESYDMPRYNTVGRNKPIRIGRNVWVGAGAMVTKGVRIGDHSVVGAGAVVANAVPPGVVVFGNPARVVWRMRGPPAAASQDRGVSEVAPDPQSDGVAAPTG
jgi:acetyltransferase-like isoleucine patch superfamily enzyme